MFCARLETRQFASSSLRQGEVGTEICIRDNIAVSICHPSQPASSTPCYQMAPREKWRQEAGRCRHPPAQFLRLVSGESWNNSSCFVSSLQLPGSVWYDLDQNLNTFILLYLLKVTINIWSWLWWRIVGLDRISLKPILSRWSGNTVAERMGSCLL